MRGSARAAGGAGLVLGKIFLYALGFVFFDRAGVRFLFGDSDLRENVEDRPALDLKFSRQIVNSNLVLHPPRFLRYVPSGYAFIASSRLVNVCGLKPAGK
jgi:hypothetical protein